jgi:hypothetical protein
MKNDFNKIEEKIRNKGGMQKLIITINIRRVSAFGNRGWCV